MQGLVEAPLRDFPASRIVALSLAEANALVARLHRHHQPVQGHRFSLGLTDAEGNLVGAVIVGRPVARAYDHLAVVEVTRLVTDGSPNACSRLYGAAARAAKALGYERIHTYVLASEPGTSLRAAGWNDEGTTNGGDWNHSNRYQGDRRTDQPQEAKRRYARLLGED